LSGLVVDTSAVAAALNFGDCFAYGLAVATGQPVLCLGDDFARTDADVLPSRHR
jgi:ribonuclease VapC